MSKYERLQGGTLFAKIHNFLKIVLKKKKKDLLS